MSQEHLYEMVSSGNLEGLCTMVSEAISKGWEPQGSPFRAEREGYPAQPQRKNWPKSYRSFDLGRNPGDFSAECTYHYDDQGRIVVTDMVTRKEVEHAGPVFTIDTEISIRDTRVAVRLL